MCIFVIVSSLTQKQDHVGCDTCTCTPRATIQPALWKVQNCPLSLRGTFHFEVRLMGKTKMWGYVGVVRKDKKVKADGDRAALRKRVKGGGEKTL